MLNDMQTVWGHHLRNIDLDQIKAALDRLPREYPNWPPTVGQFLELTKVGKDPLMKPALPKPRGDEKIALDALAEMKEILNV